MYSRKFPVSSRRAMVAVPGYRGQHVGMTRTHEEVGHLVKERRLQLRMSTPELARAAGVDPKTVRALEAGIRWPQDTSRAKIEEALGWEPGDLAGFLERGNVEPIKRGIRQMPLSERKRRIGKASSLPGPAKSETLTDEEFKDLFNRWAALYVQSVQMEWDYSRARGIDVSEARDELVATISMASQAKDDRPWTPPWGDYPEGFEPWDERWWKEPGNRERFLYWTHGEVGLHPEFRKKHPEYVDWPTKVQPAVDRDDPAYYGEFGLAAHPDMPIEADRIDSEFDQYGEENQDPDH